jgi:hypothetical protein
MGYLPSLGGLNLSVGSVVVHPDVYTVGCCGTLVVVDTGTLNRVISQALILSWVNTEPVSQ